MCNLCLTANLNPDHVHAHEGENAPYSQRRRFLNAGAVAMAAPWLMGPVMASTPKGSSPTAPANAIPPEEALKRLMAGNARYAANKPANRDFSAGRLARASAQHPIAAVLSCADSRLAPELAFDQGNGELFVLRVAGNFLTPAILSSLEYGVAVLGLPLIMVLGHSNCGAVAAAVKSVESNAATLPGHIQDLVTAIQPAVVKAQAGKSFSLLDRSIIENVKLQKEAMATKPSLIKDALDAKKIQVVGAVYDLATGKVTLV
jgi:carbonic anhydrase